VEGTSFFDDDNGGGRKRRDGDSTLATLGGHAKIGPSSRKG